MLLQLLTEPRNKNNIFLSVEEAFNLNSLIIKHNVRYSSEENPRVTTKTVMQSVKVHVCYSLLESRVISPCFCSRIEKITESKLQFFNRMKHHLISTQMFVSISTKSFLIGGWEGLVPSDGHHVCLTCLHWTFFWGRVMNNICKLPIGNLDELKIKIADEIKNILRKTLSDVFSNLVKKMHLCISVEGELFQTIVVIGFLLQ